MKKIFTLFVFLLSTALVSNAKTVVIKGGSIIPLQSVCQVKAADVQEGQLVDFCVQRDIIIDGVRVIQRGTVVQGKVAEAKKSSIAGTKGRLKIYINNMFLPSGDPLYFVNTQVSIYGKNRTPLSIITALFVWPCIFIPGSKAVMPEGYEVQAMVASNTEVNVD